MLLAGSSGLGRNRSAGAEAAWVREETGLVCVAVGLVMNLDAAFGFACATPLNRSAGVGLPAALAVRPLLVLNRADAGAGLEGWALAWANNRERTSSMYC